MNENFIETAEKAVLLGLTDLQKEVDQMLKPSKEEVQRKAKLFLQAYESANSIYQSALDGMGKNKNRRLKEQIELEYAREAFDEFQNAINAYYGQLIKVMYVYMDSENSGAITLSVEDNSIELLQINESYGSVQYHLNEIKNKFKLKNYDSTLLDAAEQSIYARWEIAKANVKSNRFLPILWKINGIWEGAKVNNLGTIAEAYINFYLAKYQFEQNLETNVRTYILHPTLGAAAVDNMSGFLVGDTSALGGRVQFAVKKDTASAMNMSQVYTEIKKIIDSSDFIDLLGKRFREVEYQKARQNQVKKLAKNIETTYKSLINDLTEKIEIVDIQ